MKKKLEKIMTKFEKIICLVILSICIIGGNIQLIYWAFTDCIFILLYYPIAYSLTCIPGYIFKKDAFKYDSKKWKIGARLFVTFCSGGLFIFAK